MNKYKKQSKTAQQTRKRLKMCQSKISYGTRTDALKAKPGQDVYRCPYCQQWHVTGWAVELAARLKRKRKP